MEGGKGEREKEGGVKVRWRGIEAGLTWAMINIGQHLSASRSSETSNQCTWWSFKASIMVEGERENGGSCGKGPHGGGVKGLNHPNS